MFLKHPGLVGRGIQPFESVRHREDDRETIMQYSRLNWNFSSGYLPRQQPPIVY